MDLDCDFAPAVNIQIIRESSDSFRRPNCRGRQPCFTYRWTGCSFRSACTRTVGGGQRIQQIHGLTGVWKDVHFRAAWVAQMSFYMCEIESALRLEAMCQFSSIMELY